MVYWLVLSFMATFFESMTDVFKKKSLMRCDEYVISWSSVFLTAIFLMPLLFLSGVPELGKNFWLVLFAGSVINALTTILYAKAIKLSDLSITTPMLAFTPVFLIITSPIMIGEFPGIFGIAGIFLIVIGSYMLKIGERKKGYLHPFRALLKEPGPRLMLLVAFIWSITSIIDKIGVQNSSIFFWVVCDELLIAIILMPLMIIKSKKWASSIRENIKTIAPISLFTATTAFFQLTAITMTLVAYVISIKRMSALLGVVFGCLIFKEKGIKEKLAGAIVMLAGALLIAFS